MGTLHEHLFALMLITIWILGMKSVSDKSRRERINTHIIFKPFFFLNCMFMRRGGAQKALLGSTSTMAMRTPCFFRPSPHNVQCLWTVHIQRFVSTPTWRVRSSQWSEAAAGICTGYIFVMRRTKRPKCAKRLWTQRLFNSGVRHELHVDNVQDSGISSGWRKVTLSFCSWKLAPEAKGKIQNFAKKYLPRSD